MGSGGITNGKTREYRVVKTLFFRQTAIETPFGELLAEPPHPGGG
jgi:hypothetical protein